MISGTKLRFKFENAPNLSKTGLLGSLCRPRCRRKKFDEYARSSISGLIVILILKCFFDIGCNIEVQYRDIRLSKIHRYHTICQCHIRYAIPGAAGHTGHVPAPGQPTGPPGRSVILHDYPHALSCCSTRHTPRNVEFSCLPLLQWPGSGMPVDC
jgi:hypothetical protein